VDEPSGQDLTAWLDEEANNVSTQALDQHLASALGVATDGPRKNLFQGEEDEDERDNDELADQTQDYNNSVRKRILQEHREYTLPLAFQASSSNNDLEDQEQEDDSASTSGQSNGSATPSRNGQDDGFTPPKAVTLKIMKTNKTVAKGKKVAKGKRQRSVTVSKAPFQNN
jgi:hypothetical protein